MARTKISEFSSTPANNTDIDSINIAEGCAPSNINDAIRELMAQLKDFQIGSQGDSFNGPIGTTTAAAGAFTTLSASSTVTLSGGTANGVTYLNGSKVLTTGSALTFDGANFQVGGNSQPIIRAVSSSTNNATARLFTDGDTAYIGSANTSTSGGSVPVVFQIGGSEQMRLTSTGLGIGTSSPASKLQVTSANGAVTLDSGTGESHYIDITHKGSYSDLGGIRFNQGSTTYGNNQILFRAMDSGGTVQTVMTLNGAGNLGLGVTPSASTYGKALEIGSAGNEILSAANDFYVSTNAYYNSGWKYGTSTFASQYNQTAGSHRFYTAPSGTAGNAISFTQAMTLTSAGDLLVGTTSSVFSASGRGVVEVNGSSTAISALNVGGTSAGYMYHDGTDFSLANIRNGALKFAANNAERARIDSSGNLLVGATSGNARLRVLSTASQSQGFYVTHPTSAQDVISCENSATSGNNVLIQFYTDATVSRGSITYNRGSGVVAYNVSSDYRAKDIIGPVTGSGELIDSTPVYIGKMKGATQERPMFIAHETPAYTHTGEKDAVDENGNPIYQQMDASTLIPVMWAELQSLRQRSAQSEAIIQQLQADVAALKGN